MPVAVATRTDDQRAAHAKYERERQRAIREGTWSPRRASDPVVEPTSWDIAWAAGFLEGDGSFGHDHSSLRVTAGQVNREPLERLLAMFGGSIYVKSQKTSAGNEVSEWGVAGRRARSVMESVRPFMSGRRRGQIDRALATADERNR